MPLPILPIAITGAASYVAWRKFKKPPAMTPDRKKIFEAAMKTLDDPAKLKTLAESFEKQGLKAEGQELRKRAAIFSAPPAVQEQRKKVFKQTMNSKNPVAIKKVAAAFYKVGHYEAAEKLRKYAKGLFKAAPQTKVKATVHGDDGFDDVGCNDPTTPEV